MSKKRGPPSAFFTPISQKRARITAECATNKLESTQKARTASNHPTFPFPIPHFPSNISDELNSQVPASEGEEINNQPDLDLLYFQPYIPKSVERFLFEFLREELFFYRVQYKIMRGGTATQVNTPRYTTVFGVDTSSTFLEDGALIDSQTSNPIPSGRYKPYRPRPLPHCLDQLRRLTEIFTGTTFNFCLVNYYANGEDSISYHSDDERFLGPYPSIASFSLGATRDFLLKHKPIPRKDGEPPPEQDRRQPLKLPLASGNMVLMRGPTQANWLHSIPKRVMPRKGCDCGRMNITFRKGVERYSTQNYYQYNVGDGGVWKWDAERGEMREWVKEVAAE
ncbi:hypothetical protein MMC28_011504 [Mycoblastus sanguinarius]|nr:hypothetical protein [Mycoblastus sanguinarius]